MQMRRLQTQTMEKGKWREENDKSIVNEMKINKCKGDE